MLAIAGEVAEGAMGSLLLIKSLMRQAETEDVLAIMDAEDAVLAKRYGSDENVAAVEAFLAKRAKKR